MSSTTQDRSDAIQNGLMQSLALHDLKPAEVTYTGHGTTVAKNIVIEGCGASTGPSE